MAITMQEGDILDAPPNTIIMHACNARGTWGKGIALKLKKKFPLAYQEYRQKCIPGDVSVAKLSRHQKDLAGTCMIIPTSGHRSQGPPVTDRTFYIACLITSDGYGKKVDPPAEILANTAKALDAFKAMVREFNADLASQGLPAAGAIWTVEMNSGLFKVPWEQTRAILEESGLDLIVRSIQAKRGSEKRGKGEKSNWADKSDLQPSTKQAKRVYEEGGKDGESSSVDADKSDSQPLTKKAKRGNEKGGKDEESSSDHADKSDSQPPTKNTKRQ